MKNPNSLWGLLSKMTRRQIAMLLGFSLGLGLVFVFVLVMAAVLLGQGVELGPLKIGQSASKVFVVTGKVITSDRGSVDDVKVILQFPMLPVNTDGSLAGIRVWKNPDGAFPAIGFQSTAYQAESVDLNDLEKVTIDPRTRTIHITELTLQRIP